MSSVARKQMYMGLCLKYVSTIKCRKLISAHNYMYMAPKIRTKGSLKKSIRKIEGNGIQ